MKILLSGGGTGGHIYPALALAKAIQEKDSTVEFLYVGTSKGLESKLVPEVGIPFQAVEIQGLRRSLSVENLKTAFLLMTSLAKAKKIIQSFQPDVVIGTGGYVCAPVLLGAAQLRIPTIIHEQNSVAGVTNKMLARFVRKIAICFEDARSDFQKYANKVVFTGNPRAQEVANKEEVASLRTYGLRDDVQTVLVFGGSRGAERINQAFLEAAPMLSKANIQAILVTGTIHYDAVQNEFEQVAGPTEGIKIVPYVDNMPALFRAVDVVVCRSGATTLTELTALGIPSVLIPSPYVTGDHQTKNAKSLVDHGAATLLTEATLSGTSLFEEVETILSSESTFLEMKKQAKQLGVPDAADRLFAIIEEITK